MMRRPSPLVCALALACAVVVARPAGAQMGSPAPAPTAAPAPSAAESAFLAKIMRDLPQRYPNPPAAIRAGYVRFTNEDRTGAISYVNIKAWNTSDPDVPAQLWYDVNGRLIGADYSQRRNPDASPAPAPPALFGISPSRFFTIGAHVHFVTCDKASGKVRVRQSRRRQEVRGDRRRRASDGRRPRESRRRDRRVDGQRGVLVSRDLRRLDMVVPNPLGQFADKNPNVVPSAHAGRGEDDPM